MFTCFQCGTTTAEYSRRCPNCTTWRRGEEPTQPSNSNSNPVGNGLLLVAVLIVLVIGVFQLSVFIIGTILGAIMDLILGILMFPFWLWNSFIGLF